MKKTTDKPTEPTPKAEPETPPDHTVLVTLPGGNVKRRYQVTAAPKAQVSQLQVELATSLLNDIVSLERSLAETMEHVFKILEAGGEVEPGPLAAEIREEVTASSRIKRLYVNNVMVPEIRTFQLTQ